MKITIDAEPQEVAAPVDEIQKQQRPFYIYGLGIKKYLEENPDIMKDTFGDDFKLECGQNADA